ncbi:MAG: DsrH/TusB family sulfur metabolism protein [Chloroflexota bacterium]
MITSLCIVVQRPKGDELSTLALRAAWAALSSAIDVKVVCVEDGVYNLLPNPGYNSAMLADYVKEGGPVYGLRRDVEARGLDEAQFVEGVELISEAEVAELIADCEASTVF